ncbi:MAG: HipA N-terminal domain-containing protein, partial [Robiginitomaculum sp.]|nr:HipA N-terminal domain-containing protein [Robiginitomaculum sp.]
AIYFEYDPEFLSRGLDISPLRLPLKPDLQQFDSRLFEGLPGVFNDSLPDGWGRLLFDRTMRTQDI